MQLNYRFSPDLGELSQEEATRLGGLMEHPDWPILVKYLHIERWATMNNGFIHAATEAQFGYCQGDIGRINKLEADMLVYHELFMAGTQVKQMEKEDREAVNNALAEYSDDSDLPLSP